jgi:Flp pilus assembly pilin Flp
MNHPALALVRDESDLDPVAAARAATGRSRHGLRTRLRDEAGATTAEYATVTGCGVGFAAVLFKFLTSEGGQALIKLVFNAIRALLPF